MQGTFSANSGEKYEGEWRAGDKHGKGTTTARDGNCYEVLSKINSEP